MVFQKQYNNSSMYVANENPLNHARIERFSLLFIFSLFLVFVYNNTLSTIISKQMRTSIILVSSDLMRVTNSYVKRR